MRILLLIQYIVGVRCWGVTWVPLYSQNVATDKTWSYHGNHAHQAFSIIIMIMLLLHPIVVMHLVSFGDPIVQYSCAMNTQCIQHSFCNCMFVLDKGWKSGYNHGLLIVFVPHRWWKSGYNHACIVGWTKLRYLCTIRSALACIALLAWKYIHAFEIWL